jgi:hypothetical protein
MESKDQLLRRRLQLLQSLSQYSGILNGSFFERELNGKARLYLSRIVNGTQRQTYIAQKHRAAVERALKQYRGLQRTVEQLCEINLQLLKQSKDRSASSLDDIDGGDHLGT